MPRIWDKWVEGEGTGNLFVDSLGIDKSVLERCIVEGALTNEVGKVLIVPEEATTVKIGKGARLVTVD